jgi:hypothetical protein
VRGFWQKLNLPAALDYGERNELAEFRLPMQSGSALDPLATVSIKRV